jgi:hypothetical protein
LLCVDNPAWSTDQEDPEFVIKWVRFLALERQAMGNPFVGRARHMEPPILRLLVISDHAEQPEDRQHE